VLVLDCQLLVLCFLHRSHEITFHLPLFVKWWLLSKLGLDKVLNPISACLARFEGANNHSEFTSDCVGLAENVKVNMVFVLDACGLPEL
jgi:hypothetical protein